MINYNFKDPNDFSINDWQDIDDPFFKYCVIYKFGGSVNAGHGVYSVFEKTDMGHYQIHAGLYIEDSNTVKVLYNEKINGVFIANFV